VPLCGTRFAPGTISGGRGPGDIALGILDYACQGGLVTDAAKSRAVLIVFGGLSGTGKTSLARGLAARIPCVYLRIDTIEQAIRDVPGTRSPVCEEGYCVAYAVAEDNLRLGRTVIADSVNPLRVTRDAWRDIGQQTGAAFIEVEAICSDAALHRQRVETRTGDIAGLQLPSWEEVVTREYEPWHRERIVIDTAHSTLAECVEGLARQIEERLGKARA
jgi:predicted kinase